MLRPGIARYVCAAPGDVPGGLYDLEVRTREARSVMPRAVNVVDQPGDRLTVLHCTDLHLLKPHDQGGLEERSAIIQALVTRINALCPDLVVCTGDLIQRYDAHKKALPAALIRWQIRQVSALLAEVAVPLYITTGNHDVAFEETRADWYEIVGGRWNGRADDYSLDWDGYHLAMLDCFAHYDGENVQRESSLTPEQIAWLRKDLTAASASRMRLVFAHYDYSRQLPLLFQDLRIDGLLYGHSGGMYPAVFAESGAWDGHLADTEAYSLLRLTPDGLASQTVAWADLL